MKSPTRYRPVTGVALPPQKCRAVSFFMTIPITVRAQIEAANCIIPTGQNLANIDDDMRKLVPEIIGESKEEITKKLEMLVRAYDPCISCSVHMLDVKFIE